MGCLKQLRKNKILKRKDFVACYNNGFRIFSKYFILYVYQRCATEQDWRFGLAVSKKIGSAVKRNRIKRLLREFFRIHQDYVPRAIDVVVVPKAHIATVDISFHQVACELIPVFYKIRLEVRKRFKIVCT